jgi:hypothetical protein
MCAVMSVVCCIRHVAYAAAELSAQTIDMVASHTEIADKQC